MIEGPTIGKIQARGGGKGLCVLEKSVEFARRQKGKMPHASLYLF